MGRQLLAGIVSSDTNSVTGSYRWILPAPMALPTRQSRIAPSIWIILGANIVLNSVEPSEDAVNTCHYQLPIIVVLSVCHPCSPLLPPPVLHIIQSSRHFRPSGSGDVLSASPAYARHLMLTSELSCAKPLNYWLARPGSASSFPLTPRTVPFITAIDSDL